MCSVLGIDSKLFSLKEIEEALLQTYTRGPDGSKVIETKTGYLGFSRLSIMDTSELGMQPFEYDHDYVVCNGELYGFRKVKEELIQKGYSFHSDSDCEIILPMYHEYGIDMFKMLDSEFAMIIYDSKTDSLIAARDPIGIRPLYYGYCKDGKIVFASEPKMIKHMVDIILPFPPGHYYKDGKIVCYHDITHVDEVIEDCHEEIFKNIKEKLIKGVEKRLDSDVPVGFLLSGGLDSSLVCSIASKLLDKPIETYAIGMDKDAIDLKYAKIVADYIGSNHHEIIMTKQEVLDSLEEVIEILGTYDITTIRASMGMYLLCKAIHKTSDIKVLLTGEISDELFGYKYTDFAPSSKEFQIDAEKRIRELHMYDVLRADRCISSNSLEARVPFGDLDFVKYVMAINPDKKINTYNMGKYLLRKSFEGDYLPEEILYRQKAAFSDAVGHSMVDDLKEYAESKYSDEEYEALKEKYSYHAKPISKESLLYREIFEKYYPNQAKMVVDYWLPNQTWKGCAVKDPSARYLSNYGDSGK